MALYAPTNRLGALPTEIRHKILSYNITGLQPSRAAEELSIMARISPTLAADAVHFLKGKRQEVEEGDRAVLRSQIKQGYPAMLTKYDEWLLSYGPSLSLFKGLVMPDNDHLLSCRFARLIFCDEHIDQYEKAIDRIEAKIVRIPG